MALLPLVLPPSVVGYFLVVLFGRRGLLGQWLDQVLDIRLIFSPAAAVIASALVALPLLVKTAQPAIEAVPLELEQKGILNSAPSPSCSPGRLGFEARMWARAAVSSPAGPSRTLWCSGKIILCGRQRIVGSDGKKQTAE